MITQIYKQDSIWKVIFLFQTEYARMENGRYIYRIHRSPMCEYMINFIHKLKHLPEKYMMNSVLENFTILQVNSHSCIVLTYPLLSIFALFLSGGEVFIVPIYVVWIL